MRSEGAGAQQIHQYGMSVLQAEKKEKAMEIFKFNRQRHPDDKFFPYLGLARGYTALGDKKNAIANWEVVLKNIPPGLEGNRPAYERALQTLKSAP